MKLENIADKLDKEEIITKSHSKNLLIWPIIRYTVLQTIIDSQSNLNVAKPSFKQISWNDKFKLIIYSIFKNPLFSFPKEIIIFNSSSSNISTPKGDFNRIVDYFYTILPDKVLKIEEVGNYKLQKGKIFPTYYRTFPDVWIKIISKIILRAGLYADTRRKIYAILEVIKNNIDNEELSIQLKNLHSRLSLLVITAVLSHKFYKFLFKLKKPKIVIIEDGHYGFDKAGIIKAANDLGIYVVEPQHGFINSKHPAYNFNENLLTNPNFKTYYPNEFWTYGEFWSRDISIPGKKTNFGNPHLEFRMSENLMSQNIEPYILVLGSGVTVSETKKLLIRLLEIAPKDTLIKYRAHPQEKPLVDERYGQELSQGILIDELELYASLKYAKCIIGELTTAIFEAVMLNPRIILWNSSYTKAYFNDKIKFLIKASAEEISLSLIEATKIEADAQMYYWQFGWEKTFKTFMKTYGV